MAPIVIQPQGRGFGKEKLADGIKGELEPGMLTYDDGEPLLVRAPRVEEMTLPRRGTIGRIMDRVFGRIRKFHAVTVLDKEQQELLREHLENLRRDTDDAASCTVTPEQVRSATERMVTLARGHHIRNADGIVTDVGDDPRYKCKQ